MIELKKISLKFGNKVILDEIDFSIHPGETKVILGPSGVGKSTILKIILGLIRPDAGEVFYKGKSILMMSQKETETLRREMAMVFQSGGLFDSLNVAQNVTYRFRKVKTEEIPIVEKCMREELSFVGLQDVEKLYPAELSGGMKKRVSIARALCARPQIMLLDEPVVGLDPLNVTKILKILLKLKEERSVTMLIVTHEIKSSLMLADEIVVLYAGKIIFNGSPEELQNIQDAKVKAIIDPYFI